MKSNVKGLSESLSNKNQNTKSTRLVQNIKITLFGSVMTLLVLRGAVGLISSSVRRVQLAPGGAPDELAKSKFTVKFHEEKEKVDYWDPAVPFHLGPKISNWDKQRALWNRNHPGANATKRGTPRVLLVTGSQPKQCATSIGGFQLLKSFKNKVDYCRLHDIELFYNLAYLDPHMTSFWAKLPLLRKQMLAHPEVEWLWWMDSDALFTNMTMEVPFGRYENYNLVLNGHEHDLYEKKSWLGMNTGSFLIRNCQWSLDLFDVWALMGPEGPVRNDAGKLLAVELTERTDFEADDQSALVHLLIKERERWGGKVMLEWDVGLHGYWVPIVEKFEEMMQTGNGWPFVTHFVGCKPCGKVGSGTYAVDRCLHQMNRAFNFADNQILKSYGYRHTTINTHAVSRVRMDTSDPLGLIHGSV